MTSLLKLLAGFCVVYLLIVAIAYAAQRRLMYFPNPSRVAPAQLGLVGVAERILDTPDGERLVTWVARPSPGRPTLLYFHGNGGNLTNRAIRLSRYQMAGVGVVILSWRSYGGSSGQPSEAVNLKDARLVYDRLVTEGTDPRDIVLYGESLGSGIAVQLAATVPVGGVVLDAPYTSVLELAQRGYPVLPVRWLLIDRYVTTDHIGKITAPLLVLHGALDTVIPVRMGQALFDLAPHPKEIVVFPHGGHVDLDQHGAIESVLSWLDRTRKSLPR